MGCAGYQYADWVGPVYPPKTPQSRMLECYARYFSFAELNFSYYRMPTAQTLARIGARVPSMSFAIKAHSSMTHTRDADADAFTAYRTALAPLIENGQLVACLLQFPHSFHYSPQAVSWLKQMREGLDGLPLVAEFRATDWIRNEVPPMLRQLGISWCAVDEPALPGLMPPLAAVTGSIGYVRFHGRNAAQWYEHEFPWQRYDYLYSEAELAGWIPRIERLLLNTDQTVLVLNNHYRGKAVENGQMLVELLPPVLRHELVIPTESMPRVDSGAWRNGT